LKNEVTTNLTNRTNLKMSLVPEPFGSPVFQIRWIRGSFPLPENPRSPSPLSLRQEKTILLSSIMENETSPPTWPDLAMDLFDRLAARNAEIIYEL